MYIIAKNKRSSALIVLPVGSPINSFSDKYQVQI